MPNIININSSEIVKLTNKLEKIGKYDLPVVCRQTLNEMAFQMKGSKGAPGRIEIEGKNQFDYTRNRSLYRAMTGFTKARGNDIGSMESKAGIVERSGRERLAEGLAEQQTGGRVDKGATPIASARVGKDISRKVRRRNYLNKLQPNDLRGLRNKQFVVEAAKAKKASEAIIFKSRTGISFVATIKSISRTGSHLVDMQILYRLNPDGVNLKKRRPFVNEAARKLTPEGPKIFAKKAKARIK